MARLGGDLQPAPCRVPWFSSFTREPPPHPPASQSLLLFPFSYTVLSSELSPKEVVELLGIIFSEFDRMVDKHGLYKTGTVGESDLLGAAWTLFLERMLSSLPTDKSELLLPFCLQVTPTSASEERPRRLPQRMRRSEWPAWRAT